MSGNARPIKRLLVLTSASGAGHDTHAQATADWCARLYGSEVEVTIAHALEDSHIFYRYAVAFYNFIQRRLPWFHHVYYNIIELLDALNPGTVGLGREYYIRLLQHTRPDAILSVMDCLNRGYFELAKTVLGPQVKCATYCTEFAGGYGFSRNWVNPRADFFFARTDEARAEALRRGMPTERTSIVGHWEPPPFYRPLTPPEKHAYLVDELKLDPVKFTLLLSTGGAGAQNHLSLLHELLPLKDRIQVIALCGRDAANQASLEKWARANAPFAIRALGFSQEMPTLLQVSSAVLARAGATTAGEALLCECPIIFNGLGGIMPQEIPTRCYFQKHGIDHAIKTAAELRPLLERWLNHPNELQQLRTRLNKIRNATTPQQALDSLLLKNL